MSLFFVKHRRRLQRERDERKGLRSKKQKQEQDTKKSETELIVQKNWEANEEEWDTETEAESSGVGTTEEEDVEDLLDKACEVQDKEEQKVLAAAEELERNPWKKFRIGDIRGTWNLYSGEWLRKCVNEGGRDPEESDWSSGVGTIQFGKHLIEETDAPYAGDMGMELRIEEAVSDGSPHHFNKPKYASTTPETLRMYDDGDESDFSIKISFLSNGFLELWMYDVWFAGIHVKDGQAVKREAEKESMEWQDCKYTGHLHPGYGRGMRSYLEACGVYGDIEYYDGGGGFHESHGVPTSDSGEFNESDTSVSEEDDSGSEDGSEEEDESQEEDDSEEESENDNDNDVINPEDISDSEEEEDDDEDEDEDEDDDDDDDEDEDEKNYRANVKYYPRENARHFRYARALHRRLQRGKKICLYDITGTYAMYSTDYLDAYVENTDREEAMDRMDGWNVGTIDIFPGALKLYPEDPNEAVGVECDLMDQPEEGMTMRLNWIPKYADRQPIGAMVMSDTTYDARITFLGKDVIEVVLDGGALEACWAPEEVSYVGVKTGDTHSGYYTRSDYMDQYFDNY
ncbi:hypothetical protein ACET3X_007153 [Alternaria dauci]|uniref:Uncharacterized protein n=1 Tax=Alternaria dauci TaxID=48095 RepID=A0ABR3UFQ6_9PLEO